MRSSIYFHFNLILSISDKSSQRKVLKLVRVTRKKFSKRFISQKKKRLKEYGMTELLKKICEGLNS